MKPTELLLRCYANKQDDQWQAFCIDFCLAAQGDSYEEARDKLDNMIHEYIYDALVGEDKEYADDLLERKAPLKQILTYHCYKFLCWIGALKEEIHRLFNTPMPMIPQNYIHE